MNPCPHAITWHSAAQCLTLWLYIQPGAPRTQLSGIHQGRLKIKVAAPPVEGQANTVLITWLAKQFNVPKQNIELTQGETTRYKKILIYAPKIFPQDWPWEQQITLT